MPDLLDLPADAVVPERHPKAPGPGERLPPHHDGCLGCADVPGGLRMQAWARETMGIRARFVARAEHTGGPGVLHGGILVTALDEALGFVPPLVYRPAVTGRLETDFRRPVPIDTEVWIDAHLEGVSGRKIYVRGAARLGAPDGPVAGDAHALYVKVDVEHFLRHGRPEDLEAMGASPEQVRDARS